MSVDLEGLAAPVGASLWAVLVGEHSATAVRTLRGIAVLDQDGQYRLPGLSASVVCALLADLDAEYSDDDRWSPNGLGAGDD